MTKVFDYISAMVLKVVIETLKLLPIAWSGHLGDFIGRLAFFLSRRRRGVAYVNLKAALGDELNERQRWKVVRDGYRHFGRSLAETLTFAKWKRSDIERHITIHGYETYKEAVESEKGVLLLTGHYGNWELVQVVAGILGRPVHVLQRDQKYSRLNELLNKQREIHGAVAISRGMNIRRLIRSLKEGQQVGVLGDLSPGRHEGVLLPFFGRKTSVATGALELAVRTGSIVLPCFIAREKELRHHIYVEEPIQIRKDCESSVAVKQLAEDYIQILEKYIRDSPRQWLWTNKRWKYSWTRKILILSDGKPGHLKQSKTVASLMSGITAYHGREGLDFETEILPVDYRSPLKKKLFFLLAPLFRFFAKGRMRYLKFFFSDAVVSRLHRTCPDFILWAGSGLAPLAHVFQRETNAKTIVVMKPPAPYHLFHYDLAIIPAHDEGKRPTHTFETVIMPSGYETWNAGEEKERLALELANPGKVKVAVFLGGATGRYDFMVSDIERLLSALSRSAEAVGDFVLTTSRRTSEHIKRFLKMHIETIASCQKVIFADEDERPHLVKGMMALADVLVVTEDSLAMISEAVGTGKKVIVLCSDQPHLPKKHQAFRAVLKERQLVKIASPKNFQKILIEAIAQKPCPTLQVETEALLERLEALL